MRKILSKWVERYFSDEEALLFFVLLAAALLVIITLGQALTPVFSGIILAFLMQGGVNRLKKHKVPHIVSVVLVFLAFIGGVAALLFIVMPLAWRQSVNLFNELPGILSQAQSVLLLLPERYPEFISEQRILELIDLAAAELSQMGQWVVTFSLNSITSIIALLIYLVLVPILVFFFLKDGGSLSKWWISFLPEKRDMLTNIWVEMDGQIANYIRGKVIEIIVVGVVTYITFIFLGINYAALLAILVGLSVLIPYIGAALVTLPVALIGFFQWGWSNEFMYLMVAYGVIQALDGNVLVPLLFSEAVNLHPVAIIVAVLVFGGVWGFWGLFFAIPLATLFKAVINAWPKSKAPTVEVEESST
ncbi:MULTISPECIES: AI-2E family transporter [unclassified Neptuniibacter]|uniref:AI-2E family transporter n=1 Tax=unclassified Neptuniibacter TaxID=2630693 RepID=UPI000C37D3D0|nr:MULTISPECIES: AI-2E family transporter [unclassified Neptuniibacter]MAY42094.1 AI-2E family transporter [Oceanospirillaceae bacterium]|tara:strand:+ start:14111 stop:15193 length:1083 start_codon:yes stop_codon:yes gene_type:complete